MKEQKIYKVGDKIEIDGRKYEVTFVQGANFAYKPVTEVKVKVSTEKEK